MSAMWTFGLKYEDCIEEIDVTAATYDQAKELATMVAEAEYEPGWKMIDLPTGGSSGVITFY